MTIIDDAGCGGLDFKKGYIFNIQASQCISIT